MCFVLGVCTSARLHVRKDVVNCGTFHGVINPPLADGRERLANYPFVY